MNYLRPGIALLTVFLAAFLAPTSVFSLESIGAYVTPLGAAITFPVEIRTFPYAEIVFVNANDLVIAAYLDGGTGLSSFSLPVQTEYLNEVAVIAGDGYGLTRKISVDFSQSQFLTLLPPTLYQNKQIPVLGFIGNSFPNSEVNLIIDGNINQKYSYKILADARGEWQIRTSELPPGKYQAKVFAEFSGMRSEESQVLELEVLEVTDRIIRSIGESTRRSLERVTGQLPQGVNTGANVGSKLALPFALTISTLAQGGLLLRNLLYTLTQAFVTLGQFLGLLKRRRETGLVYDAISKRPLSRAIVRLYSIADHSLVETDVTSSDGAFSFLPPPGYYYLRVTKPQFDFPSQLVIAKQDGQYKKLYLGGEIEIKGGETVNVSIPLDPVAYEETLALRLKRYYQVWLGPLNTWLLTVGALMAVLSFAREATRFNFIVLIVYFVMIGGMIVKALRHRKDWGLVVTVSGKPMPGVELRLIEQEFNRLVGRRMSDERGHYQFTAPPGKYVIKIASPNFELVKESRKGYKGQELLVQGNPGEQGLVIPRLVVREIGKTTN